MVSAPSPVPFDPLDDPSAARKNVLRVMAVFRRRGWIPVLASAVAVSVLVGLSLLKAPVYTASGMVQLGMWSPVGVDPRSPAAMSMFETHHQLLTSHVVVDRAMEAFGYELAEGPERQDQRDEFLSAITVYPLKDTFLIHAEASTSDPHRSAAAVNALMNAFIPFSDEFLSSREVAREQQLRKDEQRLLELLRASEERQRDLYERSGYHNFDAQRASPLVRTQDLQGRLTALQLERALAQTERASYEQRVRQIAAVPEIEQLAGLGGNDPLVAARREHIAELNVRLANLRAHVPQEKLEQLVEFRDLEAQLESARRAFRELLTAAARGQMAMHAQREAALVAQERELRELIEAERSTVTSLNQLEGQYRAVLRQVEFYERELEVTRNELRRLEARSVSGSGAMIVNPAQPPTKPRPRVSALNLIGAALGVFVLGLMSLVLWDHLDDAVMRPEDLEDAGVPLLGQVPRLDLTAVDELTHLRGSSWVAEALGLIRVNLAVVAGGLRNGALLVTSGAPGEGKSFFSLNLATALARAGGRTLLIEGDLRRPRLRPLLVLDDRDEGLSDVLVGQAQLEDVVRETEFEGLDFLPSGPCPLSPADVLLRPELEALLQAARGRYDHVVIDGPPARPLADASLLARHVHGVVHVARVGASRRSIVRGALDQIQAVGGRSLGLVLNDVTPEDDPAFGYDGYVRADQGRPAPVPGGFFVFLPQVPDGDGADGGRASA